MIMIKKRKIVLVDIDGTVSKLGDRLKYHQLKKKNWESFYNASMEDEPVMEVIELVNLLSKEYTVIFCTGRRESIRILTIKWLSKYFDSLTISDQTLLMRKDGDKRHDTIVKPELIEMAGIDLPEIAFVLEDRNSMVSKWRELGVKCFQVSDGDF